MYAINKVNDNLYQIYGLIRGVLSRPYKVGKTPLEGELRYFLGKHKLVKLRVRIYTETQLRQKLQKIKEEIENYEDI